MNLSPPALSGFSIAKNAGIFDYPIETALNSVLPICNEIVVNVGRSEDDTLQRVCAMDDPRIRVIESEWPPDEGSRTLLLSAETNRALEACTNDWALYIQADEVIHEDDYPLIREAIARADADSRIEGLVFDYLHFYGSPDWILDGRTAYRQEIRIVRRSTGIRSGSGAQGFGVQGRRPRAIRTGARVFHYGYAKSALALLEKSKLWARYYDRDPSEYTGFDFDRPRELKRFEGEHPAVARAWIDSREWPYDPSQCSPPAWTRRAARNWVSDRIERWTGHRLFEHRNFELID